MNFRCSNFGRQFMVRNQGEDKEFQSDCFMSK